MDVRRRFATLGHFNDNGGVWKWNKRKAKHYCELATMNGNVYARHNHGSVECGGRWWQLPSSIQTLILSARAGYKLSLDKVKEGL